MAGKTIKEIQIIPKYNARFFEIRYIYVRPKEDYFDVDTFKKNPPKTELSPAVEKYNAFMLKVARKIQRHIPWLPRRKKE